MQPKEIGSVRELIEELGGPKAASDLLETTPQNVVNWRLAGRIPSRLYLVHREKLSARKIAAPSSLWNFAEAAA